MKRSRSILARLMLLVFFAALVPGAALVGTSLYLAGRARADMERGIDATLNLSVNLEKSLIDQRLARMRDRAVGLADNPDIVGALTAGTSPVSALHTARTAYEGMDLITLVDSSGAVMGRITSPATGDRLTYGGLIPQVIETGTPSGALERISRAELTSEGRQLINQVRITVLPTEASADPRVGTDLEDALALVGVAPVLDQVGRVAGAVIVGDILNNDFTIVDEVTTQGPLGMPLNATIALDAIRVTTNVPAMGGGRRAVGTLYSDPVMAKLRAAQEYRGRALVGGWQWQRTIYIPLPDHAGRVIAGGYVGVPEEYFTTLARAATFSTWLGVAVALFSLAAALSLAYLLAKNRIIRPLRHVTVVLANGDLYTSVSHNGDEVGALASALNTMLGRVRQTVADVSRVSSGVKSGIGSLMGAARQTADDAQSALDAAGSALVTAEQVGGRARGASERVRELEVALARVSVGAEEQARAVQHVGNVTGEIAGAIRTSREVLGAVLSPARRAMTDAQQGRQNALRVLTALELVRLAALAAREGAVEAQSLDRLVSEIDQGSGVARDVDDALQRIARASGEALDRLWELAAVLNENGARVGAITQQIGDVSAVVSETAETTRTMGAASREIIGEVEEMATSTEEVVGRFRQARDHVTHIAESNQTMLELADQIEALARELDRVTGQFPQR